MYGYLYKVYTGTQKYVYIRLGGGVTAVVFWSVPLTQVPLVPGQAGGVAAALAFGSALLASHSNGKRSHSPKIAFSCDIYFSCLFLLSFFSLMRIRLRAHAQLLTLLHQM